MKSILVIDDDETVRDTIGVMLEQEGFRVHMAADGREGYEKALLLKPDLVIVDLRLPGMTGMEICKQLRASNLPTPILVLSAVGDEIDKVLLLEIGADDYVTKPFSPKELVARVAARLRRHAAGAGTGVVRYEAITIDADRHVVTLDGVEVKLTAKEFLLLQYLVQHRGRVLSRDVLLTDVWGYQYTGGTRTVDVHIRRLREKLPVLNQAIETVKQFGYKLL